MPFKLSDPLKYLIKLLETFRKAIENKLTAQTVNFIVTTVTVAIVILASQVVTFLLIIQVLDK